MEDTKDLKSFEPKGSYQFESGLGYKEKIFTNIIMKFIQFEKSPFQFWAFAGKSFDGADYDYEGDLLWTFIPTIQAHFWKSIKGAVFIFRFLCFECGIGIRKLRK